MNNDNEEPLNQVREVLSDNRRKILVGIGSLAAGGAGAFLSNYSQGKIVEREGELCYQTVSPEYEGDEIVFEIEYEDERDYVISSELEFKGDATREACVQIDDLPDGDYNINKVRVGREILLEP